MAKSFLLFILSLILLSSCHNREISELKKENKRLKDTVEFYKQKIDEFEFAPIIVEKNDTIKNTEQFEAMIGLAVSNVQSPIFVQLGSFENDKFKFDGDTLNERFGEFCLYKTISHGLGRNAWGGRIEFNFFDRKIVRYFQGEYLTTNR